MKVSCRANNSDAWGWEQLLWFGMGQRLRMGECAPPFTPLCTPSSPRRVFTPPLRRWAPGDALPPSLLEMLSYFRSKGVRPVAYVYPILAFLAGTGPNGTSPDWIVPGTYDATRAPAAAGPLRANLAAASFQKWLPDTLVAFSKATGAGGFSFDYT